MFKRFFSRFGKPPHAAGVYLVGDKYVIHGTHYSDQWIGNAGPPVHVVASDSAAEALGRALRETLASTRYGLADKAEARKLGDAFVKAAGFKSLKALVLESRYCHVNEDGKHLQLTPSRQGGWSGPDRGAHWLDDEKLTVAMSVTDAELGRALREAMQRCQ
jgi:hypothetical protein